MSEAVAMTPRQRTAPWWEKVIAIVALINLLLALFNLTYVPLRDFYWRYVPDLVQTYDPVKGIEPHPTTQAYLTTVDRLEATLTQPGLVDERVDEILAQLRSQSQDLLEENPFLAASKFGTFARLQRQIRQHVGTITSQGAFEEFWSEDYLDGQGWRSQLEFFDSSIRPLMESNYFRNVDDYGQFIDEFWRIDVFFIAFFGIEYLCRGLIISFRQPEVNWFDALLRRWYDTLMLLPFWRWLRLIPVTIRIHTSKLFNLERIIAQITHEPASYLADRVSQFALVRLVEQAKGSVQGGTFAESIFNPQPYLRVGNANKIEEIGDRIISLAIYKVLPQVRPDLEALLHYSLRGAFFQSDFYRNLGNVPGLKDLPDDLVENLANSLASASVNVLVSSYSDEEGRVLFDRLSNGFSRALKLELQEKETLSELETLIAQLLDEVKLNYITQADATDPTETMDEVDRILLEKEKEENL